MKICLPVDQLNGLESEIAPSFRAAPVLLIVDSDTRDFLNIDASKGSCGATPSRIDAIICAGGIGRGMFNNLRQKGIRVFNSNAVTVGEALSEMAAGSLEEISEVACCSGGDHAEDAQHAAAGGCCGSEGGHAGHDHEHGQGHGHAHGEGGCGCGH